jgi:histidinol-phosphate aminotransferase
MESVLTRRSLLKKLQSRPGASFFQTSAIATPHPQTSGEMIHLNLNENAFGPSPNVEVALRNELPRLSRYADATAAHAFAEQIAVYEHVPVEQVVLGEILGELGLYFGSEKGAGGEFLHSHRDTSRLSMPPHGSEELESPCL